MSNKDVRNKQTTGVFHPNKSKQVKVTLWNRVYYEYANLSYYFQISSTIGQLIGHKLKGNYNKILIHAY